VNTSSPRRLDVAKGAMVQTTMIPTVPTVARRGAVARVLFGLLSVVCALVLSALVAPEAGAATDADWAWPGMRYDVDKGDSWTSCSVGFPAWDGAGNRYFISAGHCFRDASGSHYLQPGGAGVNVYTPSNHDTAIGFERTYTIPVGGRYDDVSLIEMYPGKRLDGNGWQHIPDVPSAPVVGDGACLAGYRHDSSSCGTVTATGLRQTLDGYPWTVEVNTASFCALGGDSGGAVYNDGGALGIEIARDAAHNDTGTGTCSSSFIPIGQVLDVLHQDTPSLTI
jgi:hypothetical protein